MANTMLSVGSAGTEVAALHHLLAENGFSCGGDAYGFPQVFGPETEEAVRLFQSCNVGPDGQNLVPDGVAGPKTFWALGHAGGEKIDRDPLPDMPVQHPSNPVAAAALASAWREYQLRVAESPDGSNRGPRIDLYTGFSGRPPTVRGPAWCAYFASYNFERAPGGSPFGRLGGSLAIVAYCRKHIPESVIDVDDYYVMTRCGYIPITPSTPPVPVRAGDLAVISSGSVHGHVYQVAAVAGGTAWTVEGNSGNAVRTRKRPVSAARWYINFDRYALDKKL